MDFENEPEASYQASGTVKSRAGCRLTRYGTLLQMIMTMTMREGTSDHFWVFRGFSILYHGMIVVDGPCFEKQVAGGSLTQASVDDIGRACATYPGSLDGAG